MNIFSIVFASIFANNYIFAQYLGICPTIGVSGKLETSIGMGAAVTFVVTFASVITKLVNDLILVPFGLMYLQTIAFILVIASLVQLVEMFLKKAAPSLYTALGVYLPLITTNCMVLGVAIINISNGYNLVETLANGIAASLGFTMALTLLAAIRERYLLAEVPKMLKNVPLALVTLGLMAIAFSGFKGMF